MSSIVGRIVNIDDVTSMDRAHSLFGRAAVYDEDVGAVVAWHVTSEPEKVWAAIEDGTDFRLTYMGGDSALGPGLYVSGIPEYWVGRSRSRWDFLSGLTAGQTDCLLAGVADELSRGQSRGRYTRSEIAYATRVLEAAAGGDVGQLPTLAGQPFGLPLADRRWLGGCGVEKPPTLALKVAFRPGASLEFAELRARYPDVAQLDSLAADGFDGVFSRSGINSNPELVVWSGTSLVVLGVYELD